jgi:Flp pilus assembly protein TadD
MTTASMHRWKVGIIASLCAGAIAVTGVVGSVAAAPAADKPAAGQSDVDRKAKELNDQGKKEMMASHYKEAADLFRKSIVLKADPKVYFNLAMALMMQGDCGNAAAALDAADANKPDDTLRAKIKALRDKLKAQCPDAKP